MGALLMISVTFFTRLAVFDLFGIFLSTWPGILKRALKCNEKRREVSLKEAVSGGVFET
jgi:hypothetical protein